MGVRGIRRPGALVAVLAIAVACAAAAGAAVAPDPFGNGEAGQSVDGATLIPDNQYVKGAGQQTPLTEGRIISSTLSPDGTHLAALSLGDSSRFLAVFDLKTGKVTQEVGYSSGFGDGTVAMDGPLYSPDGRTLWVPQSKDILRYGVAADGTVASAPAATVAIPDGANGDALPSGLASSPDGKTLYVALNGNNTLATIDAATNKVTSQIPVGIAPRQVVLDGSHAYVSNEGGRVTRTGDFTNLTDGSAVVADRQTGGAIDGTVSVVDLSSGRQSASIAVGLHPTALLLDGPALFVANTNSDTLSVIDTRVNRVVRTVGTNPVPTQSVGSAPNALGLADAGHVLVSLGRDNAVAEYSYAGLVQASRSALKRSPRSRARGRRNRVRHARRHKPKRAATPATTIGEVRMLGLIPTEWYPVAASGDAGLGGKLVITSGLGIGPREPWNHGTAVQIANGSPVPIPPPDLPPGTAYQTYEDTASVATVDPPDAQALASGTQAVFKNNAWDSIAAVNNGAGDNVPSVIPPRIGMPSPIKHVFLIIKENRTYDQVLGDLGMGNGAPDLAVFGQLVTPNFHALARRFGTLDNFYDPARQSPDGHNWILQADSPDYVQKDFSAFYRSYPADGADALAYQRDGFLWDRAFQAGLTVRNYGEYEHWIGPSSCPETAHPSNVCATDPVPWSTWYQDSQILEGKASGPLPVPTDKYHSWTDVPALNAVTNPSFPEFDLNIPDQYRVDIWQRDFRSELANGTVPSLTVMTLMSDHTGPGNGRPNAASEVADNDLAVGRLVSEVSHSPLWKSSAIFVEEDDSQGWVDHVDAHRAPAFVISPYSAPGVDDRYYTQVNMTRTIEQILGLKTLNQDDFAAPPMYGAFTATPNLAPYDAQPNTTPLTLGALDALPTNAIPIVGSVARVSARFSVPANERTTYRAWLNWGAHQRFGGFRPVRDFASESLLDHYDWYAGRGWRTPYPGEPRIYTPAQVPRAGD